MWSDLPKVAFPDIIYLTGWEEEGRKCFGDDWSGLECRNKHVNKYVFQCEHKMYAINIFTKKKLTDYKVTGKYAIIELKKEGRKTK